MRFDVAAGLLANREQTSTVNAYNIESVLTSEFSVFIFDHPDIIFSLNADLIPSLNDLGRVRTAIDSNLRWQIFEDFFLKWTFYYSYDSRPLSVDAAKNDWAVTMLGIEYKLK